MKRRGLVILLASLAVPATASQPVSDDAVSPSADAQHAAVAAIADRSGDAGAGPQDAASGDAPAVTSSTVTTPALPDGTRNGMDIYEAFRGGLAEPDCGNESARWRRHFAHAPARLADPDSDVLPLFGHVVEALREAHLPTEFALIPFVESGYAPGARSSSGPAGLWQFVSITARNHGIRVGDAYDGRLSPAESTRAAVRYLKTLNGMFGGNWRVTAMAYNAGEHRLLQALKRSGSSALEATPASLQGLSPVTYAYVEKLHALACLLEQAGREDDWREDLDRPVLQLQARQVQGTARLDAWSGQMGHDPALVRRLNPALAQGRWSRNEAPWALVPAISTRPAPSSTAGVPAPTDAAPGADSGNASAPASTHKVRAGESPWTIARRHGLRVQRLLELNGLQAGAVLRPGMVLKLE